MSSIGRAENPVDRAGDLVPPRGLHGQLRPPLGREAIVAGAAIVFGRPPERSDPAAILEPVEGGIERPVLDLQHVLGAMFDGLRDGVPVCRPECERFEDQHVERSLQQLTLNRRVPAFRHRSTR
jgi:hypothetical protein